ncbi:MAG: glycosyltransferase family 9 protein, partial [Kiritimatiellaeota bacterium]|nr:glycosyltransferase family 9 protein [Kiritimatiellota bacterium]
MLNPGKLLFIVLGAVCVVVRALTKVGRVRRTRRTVRRAVPTVFFYEPYGMGDCIALQPLVRQWLDAGSRVIVATKPQWSDIFAPHPNLAVIGVTPQYASQSEKRRKSGFFKDIKHIRSAVGDAAHGALGIDVRGDVRSILILYAIGCGRVRTLPRYHTANDWPVFPGAAKRLPLLVGKTRRIVNSVFAPDGKENLPFPDLSHLLPAGGIEANPRCVGLLPFASWEGKMWAEENWMALVKLLRAKNHEPVILAGPGEDAAWAPIRRAENLRDWVNLISECEAVISVNTGPMHIADTLEKPLVVLEGSSQLPLWGPENPRALVVTHQLELSATAHCQCAPCHQTGSVEKCGAKCMSLITPDDVMEALQKATSDLH